MHLPEIWFGVIAFLWTGYFFLEGFDFGVGILLRVLARGDAERRVLINTIGPVWDGNEVWLITAVGGTFAAFPDWYATLLSGLYLPIFVILVCLILRGVAFEYRGKRAGVGWKRSWDAVIFWSSLLLSFLWGLLFADLVHGLPIAEDRHYAGSLTDLLEPYGVWGGAATVVLFTFHGAVFTALKTTGAIRRRARDLGRYLGLATLVLIAGFLGWTQLLAHRPAGPVTEAAALLAVVAAVEAIRRCREGWAFLLSGLTAVAVFTTLFLTLYPDVLPSSLDARWSLTVTNSAASGYSLQIMTWLAGFATPLILLYQGWTYWVFRKRLGVHHIPGAASVSAATPTADTP